MKMCTKEYQAQTWQCDKDYPYCLPTDSEAIRICNFWTWKTNLVINQNEILRGAFLGNQPVSSTPIWTQISAEKLRLEQELQVEWVYQPRYTILQLGKWSKYEQNWGSRSSDELPQTFRTKDEDTELACFNSRHCCNWNVKSIATNSGCTIMWAHRVTLEAQCGHDTIGHSIESISVLPEWIRVTRISKCKWCYTNSLVLVIIFVYQTMPPESQSEEACLLRCTLREQYNCAEQMKCVVHMLGVFLA